MTDEQKETVRKLEQTNKIAGFAMTVLGLDEKRAGDFVKVCGDKFVWDGTLRFKGATGEVAADDKSCIEFIKSEYDYFLPPAKANADTGAGDVPADLIARATAGNLTAIGQIAKIRGDADIAATKKFLAESKSGSTDKNDKNDDKTERPRDDSGKFVPADSKTKNPWLADQWNLTEQSRVYRDAGVAVAERLAKLAGVHVGAARPAKKVA